MNAAATSMNPAKPLRSVIIRRDLPYDGKMVMRAGTSLATPVQPVGKSTTYFLQFGPDPLSECFMYSSTTLASADGCFLTSMPTEDTSDLSSSSRLSRRNRSTEFKMRTKTSPVAVHGEGHPPSVIEPDGKPGLREYMSLVLPKAITSYLLGRCATRSDTLFLESSTDSIT